MIAWLTALALAADDDLSVTSLGAQGVSSTALGASDLDVLLGQRLRWEVARDTRLLLDGRFALDPATETARFEESRVRQLGGAIDVPVATLLLGRNPVPHGGPRIVDGAVGLLHPGGNPTWSLGAWVGVVPDEFTTAPLLRPGGGPIVAFERSTLSASAMGEVVLAEGGGLDRAGTLVEARGEVGRAFETSGRLDLLLSDGAGNAGLADGAVFVRVRPVDALKLDLFYDAYSSLRYQARADVDPTVTRFGQRIEQLGLEQGITQDLVDPTLYQLAGLTAQVRGQGEVQPLTALRARGRWHEDPLERFARLGPMVGVGGLLGDRLELLADAWVSAFEGRVTEDFGLTGVLDVLPSGAMALDASGRLMVDPVEYGGQPGLYADLFVDVIARTGTVVAAGASWVDEPSDVIGQDVGLAGFLRVQQWVRPGRVERAEPGRARKARGKAEEDEEEP